MTQFSHLSASDLRELHLDTHLANESSQQNTLELIQFLSLHHAFADYTGIIILAVAFLYL